MAKIRCPAYIFVGYRNQDHRVYITMALESVHVSPMLELVLDEATEGGVVPVVKK